VEKVTVVDTELFPYQTSSTGSYLTRLFDIVQHVEITDRANDFLTLDDAAIEFTRLLLKIKSKSGKVILVGNGGSAAIASHMQNDLCAAVGVRAMVCTEIPLLTALSNDESYQEAYERQIELWANTGDLLVAISSSGQSENILKAVEQAVVHGCEVVTLSGFSSNNQLRALGDLNFFVRAESYGHVELAHSILTHLLTDWACSKRGVFGDFSTNIQSVTARAKQTGI